MDSNQNDVEFETKITNKKYVTMYLYYTFIFTFF